jgi:uncharacterized integral membrane protein
MPDYGAAMARDAERRGESEGRKVDPKLVGGGVLLVILAVFVFQNSGPTTIEFLFLNWQSRLWVLLLITAMVGVLIGYLAGRRSAKGS